MKALIFDVDDTLYDQIQPFERALERHIEVAREQIEPLYLSFRRYADEVFEATATGKMSLKDSHIYRMKHALADFEYQVSDATALAIQIDYDYFQGQIELSPVFPEIFSWCQAQGIAMGIITNGPYRHQLRKIRTMGLVNWLELEHVLISGQVGITKPNPAIFQLMEERLGMSGEDICYLGDSFENDVVGAKAANWKAIWFNHRKRVEPIAPYQADKVVIDWDELVEVIQSF
ncbi:HAD-superfamily hydrolase [Streptococcus suis]|uniref:HAD family hydrolase n=1 Tax=Streptococcus suis TaxID=1307 RepID=UPI0005CCB612|nr:HAD family hydrolase [Streptococcus suis]NQG21237.1 HAD family hydrolase [Streptococcus suis]NQO48183.1 HAD family hydrolase [Streptococcus suis]NQR93619.1 HAD family hydrolase [Streptococcus suis]CYW29493.1 HAD-superfamily hydrolase [Streptococcus suis]HEM5708910.1 HAD family hydrolase [Streptococcus suis]